MPKSKYLPLPTDLASIRMLAITPSWKKTAPIRAHLVVVNLDDLDDAPFAFYEALSYTWGDQSQPRVDCKLNGHEHLITQNLDAALKRLRGRTRKRWLWVDALCINQDDLDERANQVRIMRRVYESASQVLVWLGAKADHSDLAIATLEEIGDVDCPYNIGESLADESQKAKWLAVASLLDREWFRRIWIRQEIAVAKAAFVLCGSDLIRWDNLVLAAELLASPELRSEFNNLVTYVSRRPSGLHRVIQLEMYRELYSREGEIDLGNLVMHAKGSDVTDPRDRVYGLLGLADARDKVQIDYGTSPTQVFTHAMIAVLKYCQGLDSLSGCSLPTRETENLPSWVIDSDSDFGATMLRDREDGLKLFSAAGQEAAEFEVDSSGSLRVQGFVVDTIETIAGAVYYDPIRFPNAKWASIEQWIELAQRSLRQRDPTISDSSIMDIFCRMLVASTNDNGERATSDFWQDLLESETFGVLASKVTEIFESNISGYSSRLAEVIENRVMFATSKGYIGIGDLSCQEGDLVCILLGAGVPFVLRREEDHYLLVGETYVHGIMDGEVIEEKRRQEVEPIEFDVH